MSNTYHHPHSQMRWKGPNWWHKMFAERPIRNRSNMMMREVVKSLEIDSVMLPHPKWNERGYW